MQQVKNIIFDLGGIILNIDYSRTEKAFIDLGVSNFHDLYSLEHASSLFQMLELGSISPDEFYRRFRKATQMPLTDEQIRNAWNALLLYFPDERIAWVDEIRKKYNIYLFSNTNKIHYDTFMKIFEKQFGANNFNDYFKKAYYSFEIGLRKPHSSSFLKLLELEHLNAWETLLIDDSLKNIEGAQEAGLQTLYLEHPKTLVDLDL